MRIHTKEKPYKCTLCYKYFTQSSHFKSHTRTHTGEKSVFCAYCKSYISGSLRTHQRTHTGEKPLCCSHCNCGKFFSQLSNYKWHKNTHTDEKLYACSECDKTFRRSEHLKMHNRTHPPFLCTQCTKLFAKKKAILQHFIGPMLKKLLMNACNVRSFLLKGIA